MKNFPYERQCFFENYEESTLKEEGLIEFIDENGFEIKTLNGFSNFSFIFLIKNLYFSRNSKKFSFDHLSLSYDLVSEGFGDEKNENNPISLTFDGFNTNILYLTSESPYEIDRKLNLGIIKNLHNRAKQENNKFISIKAFSIFYDENEKNEFFYDYFSKKGNKFQIFFIFKNYVF